MIVSKHLLNTGRKLIGNNFQLKTIETEVHRKDSSSKLIKPTPYKIISIYANSIYPRPIVLDFFLVLSSPSTYAQVAKAYSIQSPQFPFEFNVSIQ